MNKPIVAHFIRGFLRPTETFVYNQISALQKYEAANFCNHFIAENHFPSLSATSLNEILPPIKRVFQKVDYKIFRGITPFAAEKMAAMVRSQNIKLLHFHYLVDARFFLPVLRKVKLPSVVSGYGWDVSSFPHSKFGYGRFYLQPIFKEMDLFLAMSEDMKNDLLELGCPDSKIKIHYCGVDVARFAFPERNYDHSGPLSILFCARLAPKKGVHIFLEALEMLRIQIDGRIPFTVTIVGDGPLRYEVERFTKSSYWNKNVRFKGQVPYDSSLFSQIYREADIYVLPSITAKNEKEGIPTTIVEAMASGLPVVASRHAGIPSVISSGLDGFLVSEGDVSGVASALTELLENAKLRETSGKSAAYKALTQLNITARTAQLENIYNSLIR